LYRQDSSNTYSWLKHYLKRPYRKAVVWCGMITEAQATVEELKARLPLDYLVVLDVSDSDPAKYKEFYRRDTNAVLVCAAKHREGSDIPNLDTCVFMDGVVNRNKATFV
jgi:Rad3-related DNA helicase